MDPDFIVVVSLVESEVDLDWSYDCCNSDYFGIGLYRSYDFRSMVDRFSCRILHHLDISDFLASFPIHPPIPSSLLHHLQM